MEKCCGYCRYCDSDQIEKIKNGKFKCQRSKVDKWVFADEIPPNDPDCYWQRPNYQLSGCDKGIKLSKEYQGFYITTAIFRMLGLGENSDLDTLYAFRQNYLDGSESEVMQDYDVFAPKIAKMLELDDKDHTFAQALYDFYILGTLNLIKVGDFDGASKLYIAMYARLREKYITGPLKARNQEISYIQGSTMSYSKAF